MNRLTFNLSDPLPSLPKTGMPVTIITGFLGSGKTTLINQILQNQDDLKIAVLVNEFGDINIDSQLLISIDEDILELDNGCICCTINDDLVESVYRVLEREEKIDYLVIETTGIANPLPIILTFLSTELKYFTRIDSLLTVVDALNFKPEDLDTDLALIQIQYGDIIIINKIDLVTEEKINQIEQIIKEVKPEGLRILHSQYSQVPLPLILDVALTQENDYQDKILDFRRDPTSFQKHLENDRFNFVSFQSELPFALDKFEYFLTEQMPNNVFRAKGILWFQEEIESRHIFQLSGSRFDLQADDWTTPPRNQIIFIGRDLDESFIQEQLNNCLVHRSQQTNFDCFKLSF